ncbi:hypothetical protein BC833DRAFT_660917 [Globomyces pollinis-pini]|nr:hypothetical protein BC833DRAFT_660917 [Globomyces pollinis-pini]KAJ2992886.1 hypothetical protein HDV02_002763 [Globomyces sp. JEL0801]
MQSTLFTLFIAITSALPQTKICPQNVAPVCALKNNQKITFGNACKAGVAGAQIISNQACPVIGNLNDQCQVFGGPIVECGPSLTCTLKDARLPDLGGTCQFLRVIGNLNDQCQVFGGPIVECGPGLTCALKDARLPDLGGTCQIKRVVGQLYDTCGVFGVGIPIVDCDRGLFCSLKDSRLPDLGGKCRYKADLPDAPAGTDRLTIYQKNGRVAHVPIVPNTCVYLLRRVDGPINGAMLEVSPFTGIQTTVFPTTYCDGQGKELPTFDNVSGKTMKQFLWNDIVLKNMGPNEEFSFEVRVVQA